MGRPKKVKTPELEPAEVASEPVVEVPTVAEEVELHEGQVVIAKNDVEILGRKYLEIRVANGCTFLI